MLVTVGIVTTSCNEAVTVPSLAVAVTVTAPVPGGTVKLKPVVSATTEILPWPDQLTALGGNGLQFWSTTVT